MFCMHLRRAVKRFVRVRPEQTSTSPDNRGQFA